MFHPAMVGRWGAFGVLALVGAAMSATWCARRWRSARMDDTVALVAGLTTLALPAAVGGLVAVRFIGVVAYTLAPVAALAVTRLSDRATRRVAEDPPRGIFRSARVRFWSQGSHWRPVLIAVWVLLLPGVALLTLPFARPIDDAAVLNRLPSGCLLFSDGGTGGAAVLLRPDIPVWYDGRADYWGRDRNTLAARVLATDDVETPPFSQATCVALRVDTEGTKLVEKGLNASGSWKQIARSGEVVGWVRVPG